MSKLKALAEKELANLKLEQEAMIRIIEQTKQALIGREQTLKDIKSHIVELETFLNKPKKTKGK